MINMYHQLIMLIISYNCFRAPVYNFAINWIKIKFVLFYLRATAEYKTFFLFITKELIDHRSYIFIAIF